ncbi:hypothetical protein Zm00014a_042208 [Zea mays]|uniref:Uncharacterized protein n=1 Tax=Zea mays TaxID=4577 RepID=A0A3L6DWU4_MAIZE|nr:hypothetical protein Zm00014a_042208 [Zea mays]
MEFNYKDPRALVICFETDTVLVLYS